MIAFGAHGFDLDGLAGRLWGRHHWFGREVERHPQDVGVFDVEQALLIEVVGLAAQGAANHLLAQQLGAEGAHAQHMGDGAGVPAFGEHGDRDDAANGVAQPAWLADGVHDLAQQVLVRDVVGLLAVAGAFDDLAAEAVDPVGSHGAEIAVQGIARFELLTVDQQGARPAERVAVLVEVAEQFEAAMLQCG